MTPEQKEKLSNFVNKQNARIVSYVEVLRYDDSFTLQQRWDMLCRYVDQKINEIDTFEDKVGID